MQARCIQKSIYNHVIRSYYLHFLFVSCLQGPTIIIATQAVFYTNRSILRFIYDSCIV